MNKFRLKEFPTVDLVKFEQIYIAIVNRYFYLTYIFEIQSKKNIYKLNNLKIPKVIFNLIHKFRKSESQRFRGYIMNNLYIDILDDDSIIMEADDSVLDIALRFESYFDSQYSENI
jgi:hypothetical protein